MDHNTETNRRETTEFRRKDYKFTGLKKHGPIEQLTRSGARTGHDGTACS